MRREIVETCQALQLKPEDLAPVRLTQYRDVLNRIFETFTVYGAQGRDQAWLWEGFKGESHAVHLARPEGYRWLTRLMPSDERLWFVVEDWGGHKRDGNFWLFEGSAAAVGAVLEELFSFEYCVVAKNYQWLLCETHHNVLIAVGQPMVDRLRMLEEAETRRSVPSSSDN